MVISDLGSGGAQRVFTTLANSWAKRDIKVCVITMSSPETDFFGLDDSITRFCTGWVSPSNTLRSGIVANVRRVLALRRALIRAQAPKAVAFVGTMNILTILAATGTGIEVVISERNDPERQSLGRVWDFLRRIIYPRASLVTANSLAAAKALTQFVPDRKVAFLPNPITFPNINAKRKDGPPIILTIGRLTHQKAQDVLLQAFAMFHKESPRWHLVIVGKGESEADLKRQADDLGIAESVSWVEPTRDISSIYASAQVFALPSRYEGTPNTVLEAMSYGLAVVVSNATSGALEHIRDGLTGLIVPVNDEVNLADAFAMLAGDPDLRSSLGREARLHIESSPLRHADETWMRALKLSVSDEQSPASCWT